MSNRHDRWWYSMTVHDNSCLNACDSWNYGELYSWPRGAGCFNSKKMEERCWYVINILERAITQQFKVSCFARINTIQLIDFGHARKKKIFSLVGILRLRKWPKLCTFRMALINFLTCRRLFVCVCMGNFLIAMWSKCET